MDTETALADLSRDEVERLGSLIELALERDRAGIAFAMGGHMFAAETREMLRMLDEAIRIELDRRIGYRHFSK